MDILDKLPSIIPAYRLNATGVRSASIAISLDGKTSTHVITSGSENEGTVYQAASISKAITGIAVAKLIDQGHFTYDTLVVEYLPKRVVESMTDERTRHLFDYVTVGMLLAHTAGLSQHGFPGYDGEPPSAETVLSGEAPSNTPKVHFSSFPGARFSYSGGGTTVLQIFLETLLSKPFREIMQELVLGPLDMTRSHYGALSKSEKNYANAFQTASVPAYTAHHNFAEVAAAGLWTTPTDLLKAISAVQTSLSGNKDSLLTQTMATKFLATVMPTSRGGFGDASHGFMTNDFGFAHSGGNSPGYITYAFGSWPESSKGGVTPNTGIAVMTNSYDNGEPAVGSILAAILHLLEWPQPVSLPSFTEAHKWMPHALPEGVEINDSWRDWRGEWEGGWKLNTGADGEPVFAFRKLRPMALRAAAAPISVLEGGRKEVVLVVDGIDTCLRLTWTDDGERVIKLLQVGSEPLTLKRS